MARRKFPMARGCASALVGSMRSPAMDWRRRQSTCAPSGDLDLDLLGFCFFVLHQMHGEHAVLELGVDFGRTGVIRKQEAASESAVGALDAVIPSAFFLFLEFTFAHDRQCAFLHA